MKRVAIVLVLLLLLFIAACNNEQAGATSETTNGISAVVVTVNGNPVSGAAVFLRDNESLRALDTPLDTPSTYTKDDGTFFISDTEIPFGQYCLEVQDSAESRMAVQQGVLVGSTGIIQKDTLVVRKSGALVGSVSDSAGTLLAGAYVQVYGLGRVVPVDSVTGHFEIPNLPSGDVRIRIVLKDASTITEQDIFSIKENGTTDAGIYQPGLDRELLIVTQLLEANNLPTDTEFLLKVVTLDKDSHVRKINLDFDHIASLEQNPYIDTLIPAIGSLRLTSLSLAGNNLRSLPEEIGNLVGLYYLDVSNNNLTSLPDGLGLMVSCTEIDIEDNEIVVLPETIYQLDDLDEMHVNNNRLVNLSNKMTTWINQHSSQNNWAETQTPTP